MNNYILPWVWSNDKHYLRVHKESGHAACMVTSYPVCFLVTCCDVDGRIIFRRDSAKSFDEGKLMADQQLILSGYIMLETRHLSML